MCDFSHFTRISIILRQWLNVHFYDFIESVDLTKQLIEFNENFLKNSTNEHLRKIGYTVKISIRNNVNKRVCIVLLITGLSERF